MKLNKQALFAISSLPMMILAIVFAFSEVSALAGWLLVVLTAFCIGLVIGIHQTNQAWLEKFQKSVRSNPEP